MSDKIHTINGKQVRLLDTSSNVNDYKKISKKLLVDDSDSDSENGKTQMNMKKITRLSNTTRKPENPASVYVDADDLKEKLKYYKRIESDKVGDIPLGSRIKYVEVLQNGTFKYKPGGVITVNHAPEYLVLMANSKSWSVQLDRHIIFVERFELIRKAYEDKINELNQQIIRLQESNKNLYNELKILKKNI